MYVHTDVFGFVVHLSRVRQRYLDLGQKSCGTRKIKQNSTIIRIVRYENFSSSTAVTRAASIE